MGSSDEIAEAAARVVETVGPAVVRVGRGRGRGGGLVVAEGRVLTNAHNLRSSELTVGFVDGRTVVGTVTGVDAEGDLAVVEADTGGIAPPAWAAGDGGPALGTVVLSVAAPAGGGLRVTVGTVTATGRTFRGPGGRVIAGGIEHSAPLARGSSGTPLVDAAGVVVGLNTHRVGDGFYLAVPAGPELRGRVDALARGESRRRVRLGVALAPPHAARRLRAAVGLPEREGLLVRAVEPDGPAGRAGIEQGDLLTAAAGVTLEQPDDLLGVLDEMTVGDSLTLTVVRGTEERTVNVGTETEPGGAGSS